MFLFIRIQIKTLLINTFQFAEKQKLLKQNYSLWCVFKQITTSASTSKPTTNQIASFKCVYFRCGKGLNGRWVYYNSMATIDSESNCVPHVQPCDELLTWLSMSDREMMDISRKDMNVLQRRLYCDSSICMYQPITSK